MADVSSEPERLASIAKLPVDDMFDIKINQGYDWSIQGCSFKARASCRTPIVCHYRAVLLATTLGYTTEMARHACNWPTHGPLRIGGESHSPKRRAIGWLFACAT